VRVLHLGKYYPPCPGGIESFLGDLLPVQQQQGIDAAALVHAHDKPERQRFPQMVWRAPTYGKLLYVPFSPSFPLWLDAMIRTFDPQLLHIHVPNMSAFWALAVPSARKIPWVIHWHSDVVASSIDKRLAWAYQAYQPLEWMLLSRSVRIIATSIPYRDSSVPLQRWMDKTSVVPLGVDPRRLPTPESDDLSWAERQWKGTDLRVLCIGRLTYYKGHQVLLESLQHVDQVQLICVGGGELLSNLEERRQCLGLKVQFTGALSDSRRNALLETCDVLVLPSVERTEAFGVVLLEAMAFGKPVIATRVEGSGMGWVVEDGENGLLVPPGDAEALARAMRTMRECPGLRKQMGERGKEHLGTRFHIRRCARSFSGIYQDLHG